MKTLASSPSSAVGSYRWTVCQGSVLLLWIMLLQIFQCKLAWEYVVHVCAAVHTQVCVSVCTPAQSTRGGRNRCSASSSLETVSHQTRSSLFPWGWLASEFLKSSCLYSPLMLEWQMHATMPDGDLNLGPHSYNPSTLSHWATPPQPTLSKILYRDVFSLLLGEIQGRISKPGVEPSEGPAGYLAKGPYHLVSPSSAHSSSASLQALL